METSKSDVVNLPPSILGFFYGSNIRTVGHSSKTSSRTLWWHSCHVVFVWNIPKIILIKTPNLFNLIIKCSIHAYMEECMVHAYIRGRAMPLCAGLQKAWCWTLIGQPAIWNIHFKYLHRYIKYHIGFCSIRYTIYHIILAWCFWYYICHITDVIYCRYDTPESLTFWYWYYKSLADDKMSVQHCHRTILIMYIKEEKESAKVNCYVELIFCIIRLF